MARYRTRVTSRDVAIESHAVIAVASFVDVFICGVVVAGRLIVVVV
jgi:hypothetical protein